MVFWSPLWGKNSPARLRVVKGSKGSETGDMATMNTFLRNGHGDLEDPSESVVFGKSTANQI